MVVLFILFIILVIIIVIEVAFYPRLDYTREHKLLLWYSTPKGRKYIVLM